MVGRKGKPTNSYSTSRSGLDLHLRAVIEEEMATPLDSKLLGEKKQNYASSSEDSDDEHAASRQHRVEREISPSSSALAVAAPDMDGLPQTGPKGVLTDYYRAQQEKKRLDFLEKSRRDEIIKQHIATVKPGSEENREDSDAMMNLAKALDTATLDQDPFIQQYRGKRLQEMKEQAKLGAQRVLFGNLVEIRGDRYASIIDSAPSEAYVIMHIYDEFLPACQVMNKCLTKLAKLYETVKFCRVQSYSLGVSEEFEKNGLPAILVYKRGELVGNHLKVCDTLGVEFTADDVEGFLHENHCLPSQRSDTLITVVK